MKLLWLTHVIAAFVLSVPAWAQGLPTGSPPKEEKHQAEPDKPNPSPDSPRLAYIGFVDAIQQKDPRAKTYLDPRGLKPGDDGDELAHQLAEVMNRQLEVDPETLSELATGDLEDGLAAQKDRLGTIKMPSRAVSIDLLRAPRGVVPAWRFSPETVRAIPALYDRYGDTFIARYLPPVLYQHEFLNLRLWQWLGLIGAIFVAYLLSWLISRTIVSAGLKLFARSKLEFAGVLLQKSIGPGRLLLCVALCWIAVIALRLDQGAYQFVAGILTTALIYATVWLLFRLADTLSDLAGHHFLATGRSNVYALLPLGRKTVKVLLGAVALLAMLQTFGVNVTALIAGLGVGGLAVALAAQKTIEHLFGGIVISVDQPVRVGEFCKFGSQVGTVEDIGLRSVRMRTLDRTIVTVPNAEFANMQLENYSVRDKIRLNTILGLRYETSPDQMRSLLLAIREMLLAHPKVLPGVANVRLVAFNSSSLDVEIFTYIGTSDWNEFLAIREDIFLRLLDMVAAYGSGFAFPSATHYVAADTALDGERVKEAEARTAKRRADGSLWMQDIPEDVKASLRNTITYPG